MRRASSKVSTLAELASCGVSLASVDVRKGLAGSVEHLVATGGRFCCRGSPKLRSC